MKCEQCIKNYKKVITITSEQLLELSTCPKCGEQGAKAKHSFTFSDEITSYYYECKCGCRWNIEEDRD